VIAAAHSQQNTRVMCKAVRESINQSSRQANSEVTANNLRITHNARDLIQTPRRHFGIDMDKPKNVTTRDARAGIHLHATIALAPHKLITKTGGEPICTIGASTVRNNNLSFGRSLAEMLKTWPYQRRLIKDRNNDREPRSNAFLRTPKAFGVTRSHLS